ncbi:MAG: CDP-alcohol phosphatidyltransferase family protein [Candidatus Cloacimonetes bacterium]|nr:CDP-alcohol phosphatidyltransferase family protein [Candidatus Cloacimonadota bacterium]
MPNWVTPDILTILGLIASIIICVFYFLTNYNWNFIWIVNLGFLLNWFGDSLDGTLARYRKIERPKYGFFVDHIADIFAQFLIALGVGLSPYMRFDFALYAVMGYLMLEMLTHITTYVCGIFRISYGKIGPTEVRVVIILINTLVYYMNNPKLKIWFLQLTLFDLLAFIIGTLFIIGFLIFSIKQIRILAIEDPPKNSKINR